MCPVAMAVLVLTLVLVLALALAARVLRCCGMQSLWRQVRKYNYSYKHKYNYECKVPVAAGAQIREVWAADAAAREQGNLPAAGLCNSIIV